MDRGDEISEATTVPQTRPPGSDNGGAANHAVPLPLPPRAFAPLASGDVRPDEVQPIGEAAAVVAAGDEGHRLADEAFAQIREEASVRSAKAFIEDLRRATPPTELWLEPEDRREPSIDRPAFSPSSVPPLQHLPTHLDPTPFEKGRIAGDPAPKLDATSPLEAPEAKSTTRHLAWRIARLAGLAAVGWLALVLVLIAAYRFVNPPISALMLQKLVSGGSIAHEWVAIDNMSPNIVRAVLLSEDGRFCEHNGIDYEALQQAVEQAANGGSRGASTISMQVVKNLFLWPSKSYLRKAIEFPLTYVMEFIWPKRRIMEVYLNIAEWGPGIFGIQQAAQYHFNKTAWGLTAQEAARLAVALPNPIARDAGDPGYGTQRLAGAVQVRMRLAPQSQLACVMPKRRI